MVKQNKGKDYDRIPKSKLIDGENIVSIKYDGHYTQIHYDGADTKFYTSGGKEFYIRSMAEYINNNFTAPFKVECEFNYNCEGILGDRGKSAILTTYRTDYINGTRTQAKAEDNIFRVLDILDSAEPFSSRLRTLVNLFYGKEWFSVPRFIFVKNLAEAKSLARLWIDQGYEGAMCKAPQHIYQPGKKTNDIIKLKKRLTADLLCSGVVEGIGKYTGMIGSLVLEDKSGRIVAVGSGLSDYQRDTPGLFIGKVIEIAYERLQDTYVQPVFKQIRLDKTREEID